MNYLSTGVVPLCQIQGLCYVNIMTTFKPTLSGITQYAKIYFRFKKGRWNKPSHKCCLCIWSHKYYVYLKVLTITVTGKIFSQFSRPNLLNWGMYFALTFLKLSISFRGRIFHSNFFFTIVYIMYSITILSKSADIYLCIIPLPWKFAWRF